MNKAIILCVLACGSATPVLSQQLDPLSALKEVTAAVCVPIGDANTGSLIKTKLEAEAGLKLQGVLKKFASAGLEGAGSIDSTEYVNGLAGDALAGEIGSQRDCNLRIYNDFSGPIKEWVAASAAGTSADRISSDGDCSTIVTGDGAQTTQNCTITK